MKLLGRDISGTDLLEELEARLRARGLMPPSPPEQPPADGVEPRVDPLTFNLEALERHGDPSVPMPLQTHRGGLSGRLLLLTKRVVQRSGQILLKEALGRQRIFNGQVRDSYAQLAAEVLRLRSQVEALKAAAAQAPLAAPKQGPARRRQPAPARPPKAGKGPPRQSPGRKRPR